MTCERCEVIGAFSDKICKLPFDIPIYFEDFITREIFNAVLKDRRQILALLEAMKSEQ